MPYPDSPLNDASAGIPILEQSVLDFDNAQSAAPPLQGQSPIILDLDGDGVETTGVTAGAYFDHNANGFAEQTGWAGADDGLLVWDRNGDGRINDGKELFGNETLLADGTKAADGYAALAELDTNADGIVDANDAVFANLRIWQDVDGDGYSGAAELKTLTDLNIQSINIASTSSTYIDANGNEHRKISNFTKTDGTIGQTADVWFKTDKLYTIQEEYLTVPTDIAVLPDLRGYGNVYDLQQAMVRDATGQLKTLVESFVAETNPGNRNTLLEQTLFKWTGSDTLEPASRGGNFDARKLSVLEKFYGQSFNGTSGPNPIAEAVASLNQSYTGLSEMLYAQLMAQTHLKSLYDLIAYSWDSVSQSIRGDLSAVGTELMRLNALDQTTAGTLRAEFIRSMNGLQATSILDENGLRTATGTDGDDVFRGWEDSNVISAGGGNDSIVSGAGNDTVYGGAGNDSVTDSGGTNLIDAGTGDDTVTVTANGSNTVLGGAGNDTLVARGSSILDGGDGDDVITNTGYDYVWYTRQVTTSVLTGGAGNDTLTALDAGINTLDGGVGNDTLIGAGTEDTYVFNRGDGADSVRDTGGTDSVRFGAGIAASDFTALKQGNDLVVRLADPANPAATDSITVKDWFLSGAYRIESLVFADGTSLSSTQVEDLVNYAPTLTIPLANYVVPEDLAVNIVIPSGTFSDPDNDVLTYSATLSNGSLLPGWLSFNAATGTFVGTSTNSDVGTLNIRIIASDPAGLSISTDFSLTVANVNDAPTVAFVIADQGATEDAGFNFTLPAGTFADIDVGDSLSYTATLADGSALPTWLSFDDVTRTFVGTPGNGGVGTYAITVTATDSAGVNVEDVFALTVGNVNDAPITVASLADLSVNEDTSFSLSVAGTFSDDDAVHGDVLTYQATLTDGSTLPSWLVFDSITQTFSGVPGNGEVGTYGIRVTATDLAGLSISDEFLLSIANINDAPVVASSILNGLATEDSPFSYTLSASTFADVDAGDVLIYTASLDDGSALPEWLVFDPSAGAFAGTPTNNDVGSLAIRVTATDSGGASVSNVFTLSVTNVNDAPVTANTIASQVATEDSVWSFQVPAGAFTDVDVGDTLVLGALRSDGSALPAWLVFDSLTGTFTGTPGNADVGALAVRVTATDASGAAVSQVFTLTVANTNDGPVVANPVPNQSAAEGSAFSYTVPASTFSDIDVGDTLSYSAALADGSALPAWLTFNSATRTFSGTPANGYSGVYDVRIIATDTAGLSVSDVFSLTVADTLSNVFTGTSSANALNGTVGADTLQGLGGNDTLYGYAGNDTLDGGSGSDTMIGGLGNDIYVVNANGDVVTENTNEGTDIVQSSITYTLSANVENLALTGTGNINGTGNSLDNILTGNSANNTLTGNAGNDTLYGGAGNDVLNGGTGNDTYVFGRGDGLDVINDNDSTAGNSDTATIGVDRLNIVFARSGNNLLMSLHGGTDTLTVQSWYSGVANQTETIRSSEGSTLANTQVEQLIQAMATFGAQNGGISWDQAIDQRPDDVQAILAANWMPAA